MRNVFGIESSKLELELDMKQLQNFDNSKINYDL